MDQDESLKFKKRVIAFERCLQDHLSEIFCPVHLCLGHEDVAVALRESLRAKDWIFSYHRAHGHYLAKGGSPEKLWDEIMGYETGINAGFGGSQGFSDPSINFHCSAIVGGLVGVATGCAYALKMNESNAIVISIVGDAGTEQGVYWESLNFAALHYLRIAYIVENNGMSVDSRISERQARPLVPKAQAFGVQAVDSVAGALSLARHGRPSFYEAKLQLQCDHINGATMPLGYKGAL